MEQSINKPFTWTGKALSGEWDVTLKLDGVRAIWHDELGWQSRAGKPLHNIPRWTGGARDCELYVGSFRDTIIASRTRIPQDGTPLIRQEHLYGLDQLDPRLQFGTLMNPSADDILRQLTHARAQDFEGLVLRQGDRWLKVKPSETHDIPITDFVEGRGKHAGRLGVVHTPLGNVGSGFSDEERVRLWGDAKADRLIGQVIEVSCMEFTTTDKFRHPRFVRMRPDKLVA
jgi:DNA ligase-1